MNFFHVYRFSFVWRKKPRMGCAMFGSDQADIKEINADFRRDKRTSKIDCRRRSTKSNDKII